VLAAEEVRADVDRHHPVPVLAAGPGHAEPRADPEVHHHAVEPAESLGGPLEHLGSLPLVGGVRGDHLGGCALGADQLGGPLGALLVEVGHPDRGALPAEQHRHRPSIPDRRVLEAVVLLARTHDQDPAAVESPAARGLAPGLGRCRLGGSLSHNLGRR
jgi:hypothetical protein